MKILEQKVLAKDVFDMINRRLDAVDTKYKYAMGGDKKKEADVLAEAKWELAELKMQFADLLCEQIEN